MDLNSNVTSAIEQYSLRTNNDDLIDIGQIIEVLFTIFETVEKSGKAQISVPQCVDMTLNWLLNVYDRCV